MNCLSAYLEQTKTTQAAMAEKLGISHGAMSRILSGERRPSPALTRKIEAITGISRAELRPDVYGDAA